jgi:hypothetical protein
MEKIKTFDSLSVPYREITEQESKRMVLRITDRSVPLEQVLDCAPLTRIRSILRWLESQELTIKDSKFLFLNPTVVSPLFNPTPEWDLIQGRRTIHKVKIDKHYNIAGLDRIPGTCWTGLAFEAYKDNIWKGFQVFLLSDDWVLVELINYYQEDNNYYMCDGDYGFKVLITDIIQKM